MYCPLVFKFFSQINFISQSQLLDSNQRPAHYEGAALPPELNWLLGFENANLLIK